MCEKQRRIKLSLLTDEEMEKKRELIGLIGLMESVVKWNTVAGDLKKRNGKQLKRLERLLREIEERNAADDKIDALHDEIVSIKETLSSLSEDIVKKNDWKAGEENIKKAIADHVTDNQKQLAPLSERVWLIWLAVIVSIIILIAIVVSSVWVLNQTTRLRKEQRDFKKNLEGIREQRTKHRDGATPEKNAAFSVAPDGHREHVESIDKLNQSIEELKKRGTELKCDISDRDRDLETVKAAKEEVEEKLHTTTAKLTETKSANAEMQRENEDLRTKHDPEVLDRLNEALGSNAAIPPPVYYLCLTLKADLDMLGDTEDDERKRLLRGTFNRLDESIFLQYQNDPNQLGTVRDAVARTVNELLLKDLYTCEWPTPGTPYDPDLHHAENEAGNTVTTARTAILKSAHDDRVISKARVTTER